MAQVRIGSHEPVMLSGSNYEQILADLRHAYQHLVEGTVGDEKKFADGLIAPAIRRLEAAGSAENFAAAVLRGKAI